jgi:hypothetical protein
VEKYLNVYKAEQGKSMPPGPVFKKYPGYLSPAGWVTEHGAVLWAIAEHALLTGDTRFIREWTQMIVKGCEWIQYARRIKVVGAVPGLMPPAVATDNATKIQAVWSDGWTYKGLITSMRLLQRIGHPRAAEFAAQTPNSKNFV